MTQVSSPLLLGEGEAFLRRRGLLPLGGRGCLLAPGGDGRKGEGAAVGGRRLDGGLRRGRVPGDSLRNGAAHALCRAVWLCVQQGMAWAERRPQPRSNSPDENSRDFDETASNDILVLRKAGCFADRNASLQDEEDEREKAKAEEQQGLRLKLV